MVFHKSNYYRCINISNIKTKKIYCANCHTLLYEYYKAREGHLVKCWQDNIKADYTRGDLKCPNCNIQFARETIIRGRHANKIIQGKVYVKH